MQARAGWLARWRAKEICKVLTRAVEGGPGRNGGSLLSQNAWLDRRVRCRCGGPDRSGPLVSHQYAVRHEEDASD